MISLKISFDKKGNKLVHQYAWSAMRWIRISTAQAELLMATTPESQLEVLGA